MGKFLKMALVALVVLTFFSSQALAHFGMLIPSKAMVTDKKDGKITLDLAFAHPRENEGMDLATPKAFKVTLGEESQDLLPALKPFTLWQHKAFKAEYTIKKPGVYLFSYEPKPYFEPAEDCYIVHYTKVIVPALGEEDGWVTRLVKI